MRTRFVLPLCSFVVLAVIGCGSGEDDPLARNNPRNISQVPGGPVGGMELGNGTGPAIDPATQPANPAGDPASSDGNANPLVEATAETVGTKGKNYGGGLITEPIRQYFNLQDRVKLLTLDANLTHYRALNGQNPATMEQYIEEIVKPSQIKLPDLPPGKKYVYDPKEGKLFVQSE